MASKKNILIGCEYGYGMRHLYRLLMIQKLYAKYNYNVFIYYYRFNELKNLILTPINNINIYETPIPNPQAQNLKITNYGDILIALGIYEKDILKSHFAAWTKILNEINPSLVICENAPILNLVASSKIPTVTIGDGISVLPFVDLKFPILREDIKYDFNGEKAIENINYTLKKFHAAPLDKLGNIWNKKFTFITHIPQVDIYRYNRHSEQTYYPLSSMAIKKNTIQEKKIFLYLYPDYRNFDTILIALVSHGFQGMAVIPGADKKTVEFLEKHNIKVWHDFNFSTSHSDINANLIVHHGGIEMTQHGLLQSIPQIVFPKTLNNFLIARYLSNKKYGLKIDNRWLGIYELGRLISSYESMIENPQESFPVNNNTTLNFNEFKNRMLKFA